MTGLVPAIHAVMSQHSRPAAGIGRNRGKFRVNGPTVMAGLDPAIHAIRRVERCTRTACLAPYAPTGTLVRRGTYYAFQPGNDVHEYAAEVAIRYYRENRAVIRGEPAIRPVFKCGPDENRHAWEALRDEFFGGVDLVPPC